MEDYDSDCRIEQPGRIAWITPPRPWVDRRHFDSWSSRDAMKARDGQVRRSFGGMVRAGVTGGSSASGRSCEGVWPEDRLHRAWDCAQNVSATNKSATIQSNSSQYLRRCESRPVFCIYLLLLDVTEVGGFRGCALILRLDILEPVLL